MNEEDLQNAIEILRQDRDIDISDPAVVIETKLYDCNIWEISINSGRVLLYGECPRCGKQGEIIEAPDPFASEIHDDYADAIQCNTCYYDSAMDI